MNNQSNSGNIVKNMLNNYSSENKDAENKNKYYYPSAKHSNKKKINRKRFLPEEDHLLLSIVSYKGITDWNIISHELSKRSEDKFQRTPRQCKDRYLNYLSPEINNKQWTREEDQCLIFNVILYQHRWCMIKKFFPGRSEITLKNRFIKLRKEGLGFLRQANQIDKNSNPISLLLKNVLDLQNQLNKFNSSKENCIKSAVTDSLKILEKYTKINNGKIKKNNSRSQNEDKLFENFESDCFEFQDILMDDPYEMFN